ncbi:hypothetical protein [Guptibacillus spartinae]|uniref:hypothetical protein n=1 Tax=Guptibacillus spartinae TaxID=3025679 RepID=UPI00235F5719|nr:hypothetical protein [Pseudalkalibacillus spartinae]
MKKNVLFILSSFLILGLFACSNQNGQANNNNDQNTVNTQEKSSNQKNVRKVVWNQLSKQQKESIKGTWKDGNVSKVTLEENMMSEVKDKSYGGKEVYRITFPKYGKSEPNFVVVFADMKTFNYIGYPLVR